MATTTSNQIELPVSFGEAFDKLSILDIKLQKIRDARRIEVQKEYDLLSNKLMPYMNESVKYYYELITEINLNIWNIQDDFRYKTFTDTEKGNICLEILDENDRRFRIKNKIDTVLNSNLKEQKGYARKCCFLVTNNTLENSIALNGIVRYISTSYDKVVVTCNTWDVEQLKTLYCNDPNIELVGFNNDENNNSNNNNTEEMEVYIANVVQGLFTIIDLRGDTSKYETYRTRYYHIPNKE